MTPRLKMTDVRKSFESTVALASVSLEVLPGQTHALIGENGAGKSTLMKVLSGACQPDCGRMELDGECFVPRDPLHARRSGIAMIYQELNLAPHLTAEENILLGRQPSRFGWINRKERKEKARKALAELGQDSIPLTLPIQELSVAQQQMVEIARALAGAPRVLIMDEPTSSLTQVDTEKLFEVMRRLQARNVSIIYISHFLEECQRVADRFTVLRDGQTAGEGNMRATPVSQIIRWMAGREISEIYPRSPRPLGETVLELRCLAGKTKPRSASLALRKGEILGIAGLIGAGRTETLRACFGLDPVSAGEIRLDGSVKTSASPAERLRQGFGLVSENRKEEGLMLNRSIADNLTLSKLRPFSTGGILRGARQAEAASNWMEQLGVRAAHSGQAVGELSGGNQQKVAIGRLLHQDAQILLLDEPTRGIDVGSKAQIYRWMARLAAEGKSIIFVSSYLPELLGVCDTIAVMSRGILQIARPAAEWTEHAIIEAAVGQKEEPLAS